MGEHQNFSAIADSFKLVRTGSIALHSSSYQAKFVKLKFFHNFHNQLIKKFENIISPTHLCKLRMLLSSFSISLPISKAFSSLFLELPAIIPEFLLPSNILMHETISFQHS